MMHAAGGGILFIENREKTRFWAAAARELERRGHRVAWMVQNPLFARDLPGEVHLLPFPNARTAEAFDAADFPVLCTDRGSQYFAAGTSHYPFYASQVEALLDRAAPTLVIGESTLFHELLAVDACRRRGIAFVHPAAGRYPSDRFLMFDGETQNCYVRSDDRLDSALALEQAERIAAGREIPLYMAARSFWGRRLHSLNWAFTRGRIWAARLLGERYNTPSLSRKVALERIRRRSLRRWAALASVPGASERSILYPLQMQPEANIDVWGRPYSDQADVVRRLLTAAPPEVTISLKANPKAKYEISSDLLTLAATEARVRLLPLDMKMPVAHRLCLGAVTICGTVGFEAVFGRGRCVSVRHPLITAHFPSHAADTPEAAVEALLFNPAAGVGSVKFGAEFLGHVYGETFPGLISDPFSAPACVEPGNVRQVADAVAAALAKAAGAGANRIQTV